MYLELGPAFDPSPLQNFMAQMMENPPFINHVLERAKIVHTIFLSWKVRSAKKGGKSLATTLCPLHFWTLQDMKTCVAGHSKRLRLQLCGRHLKNTSKASSRCQKSHVIVIIIVVNIKIIKNKNSNKNYGFVDVVHDLAVTRTNTISLLFMVLWVLWFFIPSWCSWSAATTAMVHHRIAHLTHSNSDLVVGVIQSLKQLWIDLLWCDQPARRWSRAAVVTWSLAHHATKGRSVDGYTNPKIEVEFTGVSLDLTISGSL